MTLQYMPASNITITFPDGSSRAYEHGVTGREVAESISMGLARAALSVKVGDQVRDLGRPIEHDAKVQILTWDDPEGKETFWHSSAHLMAEALEALYPGVKFGIGPPVDRGFYYDIDLGAHDLAADELVAVEEKMQELAGRDAP